MYPETMSPQQIFLLVCFTRKTHIFLQGALLLFSIPSIRFYVFYALHFLLWFTHPHTATSIYALTRLLTILTDDETWNLSSDMVLNKVNSLIKQKIMELLVWLTINSVTFQFKKCVCQTACARAAVIKDPHVSLSIPNTC